MKDEYVDLKLSTLKRSIELWKNEDASFNHSTHTCPCCQLALAASGVICDTEWCLIAKHSGKSCACTPFDKWWDAKSNYHILGTHRELEARKQEMVECLEGIYNKVKEDQDQ